MYYDDLFERAYAFDLETAINEYFENLGIDTKATIDYDRNDPDFETYDLTIYWEEDEDFKSFTVRNCQRLTEETLFDLWVRDREAQHQYYLEWLAEQTA